MNTHNICFHGEIGKILCGYPLLSVAMLRATWIDNTYTWTSPLHYSQLSLSRIPRDSLKYFEISVPRHIRFAKLRKNTLNNHI